MSTESNKFSAIVKNVRSQLGLSQEDLAHKLSMSFATVNRWENGKTMPSKLARIQFDSLCKEMREKGLLKLP